jgi:hypothetical protein
MSSTAESAIVVRGKPRMNRFSLLGSVHLPLITEPPIAGSSVILSRGPLDVLIFLITPETKRENKRSRCPTLLSAALYAHFPVLTGLRS